MKPKISLPFLERAIALILAICGAGALISANQTVEIHVDRAVTPPAIRNGWNPSAVEPEDVARFQTFAMADPAYDSEGAQVKLWEFAKQINDGEHFPTFRQETGDCVGMGAANAGIYLQAVQIALNGAPFEFKPLFQPWIYGVSRTAPDLGDGKLGRSAGSVGSWAAGAVQKYGVLAATTPGVPKYSGRVADDWGFKGPPEKFYDAASQFKIRTIAQVRSYEDVRDALANGYPVTVASNQGFAMEGKPYDGKLWGVPRGHWAHQMCFIAVDDLAKAPNGARGAVYCLNSWGAAAHGEPVDDAPPGGFWVDRRTVDRMVAQNDSWAFSNFDGFPLRDLDFRVFRGQPCDVAEIPEPGPMVAPLSYAVFGLDSLPMNSTGGGLLLLSSAGFVHSRRRRRSTSRATVA